MTIVTVIIISGQRLCYHRYMIIAEGVIIAMKALRGSYA